ncbi:MAG: cell division protein FtsX [Roseovarius sp.]|nr:cell division protein FtsX [Roseovarius sp.]
MKPLLDQLAGFVLGDVRADQVVPPTGITARLTLFSAAVMAFVAVCALSLALAAGRLADRWENELARTATLRISAPSAQMAAQTKAALRVLETTTGVAEARALSDAEQAALLAPWFGLDLPVDQLPIPRLIEIVETDEGMDGEGLRLRLAAEVPGAVLDDHNRWRTPLVLAAERFRLLGLVVLLLIGAAMAAMITLAANASLAANAQVISVLRLVGARDSFIAGAFVRRFTLRALFGAAFGVALGCGAILLLPRAQVEGGFLTGLGFQGWHWLLPLVIVPLAAAVAYAATRAAAQITLRNMP